MNDSPSDGPVSISYDSETETYRVQFDDDTIAPSMAVVEAVASIRDVDPTELEPLVETIDPMALDRLIRGADERTLVFRYLGHEVTIRSQEVIEIDPAEDRD